MSLDEVNQILSQQIGSLPAKNPAEAAAILLAQHYAEHFERFDPEAIATLRQYYEVGQVSELEAQLHDIVQELEAVCRGTKPK